ncbi:hypothetical protein M413DRAFT_59046 [Hebeloma cylindrosporum]|uniref:Uncharacterized protein n=1 Tax=Hebeloma cylindrosporum TaxID=76867 RepID=A0A0C2YG85_HEBCY|nr:hypothetical protein M413DRAFT_59046 [Hebeloma cylindrosporum h7]
MPSLRRTASSPAVRSSPYSNGGVVARGNGHRRSSGSETTSRRVLADIEWWRVSDGQCDPSADQEQEDRNQGAQDLVPLDVSMGIHIQTVDAGVERQSPLSLPWISGSTGTTDYTLPTEQFSGLSITPHTPTRRHHALESSSSSLESTPEAAAAPLEGFALGMSDMDMEASFLPLPSQRHSSRFGSLSPMLLRPFAAGDYLSLKDDHEPQYADFAVSPLSSAPDFLN